MFTFEQYRQQRWAMQPTVRTMRVGSLKFPVDIETARANRTQLPELTVNQSLFSRRLVLSALFVDKGRGHLRVPNGRLLRKVPNPRVLRVWGKSGTLARVPSLNDSVEFGKSRFKIQSRNGSNPPMFVVIPQRVPEIRKTTIFLPTVFYEFGITVCRRADTVVIGGVAALRGRTPCLRPRSHRESSMNGLFGYIFFVARCPRPE